VSLDGTLITIDRVAARNENGHHLWYSGKHTTQGGNVQILADPGGFPVWSSPVEPGSVHDITAARDHCLPALYGAAAGLPTLTDKGYQGAGIGVARCRPVARVTTAGQRHDSLAFTAVMNNVRVGRPRRGRPQTRPGRVMADKAYSTRRIRTSLRGRGITATIPEPANQIAGRLGRASLGGRPPAFDREAYKRRNAVERAFNSSATPAR